MDLNDFSIDLDGGPEDLSVEVELGESLKAAFEIQDLELSQGDDSFDFEEELTLGEDDPNEVALSDSIFIKAGDSIVETMSPYAKSVREVLAVCRAKQNGVDALSSFIIPDTDFPFMPSDVFPIFCSQLKDFAQDPEKAQLSDDEVAAQSIEALHQATLWSPQLQKPEYIAGFKRYYNRLSKVVQAGLVPKPAHDMTASLDTDRLREALNIYEINTLAFEIVNNFFADPASVASTEPISTDGLGDFFVEYMSRNKIVRLKVKDIYAAVGEYLGSDDIRDALQLSVDEMLEMQNGELLRRVLLYELDNEILYPSSLRGEVLGTDTGRRALVLFLMTAIQNGSIAASLLFAIGNCMGVIKEWRESLMPFLDGLLGYFLAMLKDRALVHPVYYGHVTHRNGVFVLSYAVGDKTYEVESDSILCDVVGDKSGARCIPYPLVDGAHGYTVCPPPTLYNPLINLTRSSRTKVLGSMFYKFTPTISWLSANQVLAEDQDNKQEELTTHVNENNSSLLQFLIGYSNEFEDNKTVVSPQCVAHGGLQFYTIDTGISGDETRRICSVVDNGIPIANNGVLLMDTASQSTIVRFTDVNGRLVEEAYPAADCETLAVSTAVSQGATTPEISLSNFLYPAESTQTLDTSLYREAVRKLCALCALDYNEELELAKDTVAREFYYVMGIPSIDTLVSSKLLNVFEAFVKSGEKLDASNFASLRELFDILYGVPNAYTDKVVWDAEALEILKSAKRFTVDSVCQSLDAVGMDTLALWMINPSEIRRLPDRKMLDALSYVPEINSRLMLLEDKLIVMKVMAFLGPQVLSVFGKRRCLVVAYNTQLDCDNFNTVNTSVINASKMKEVKLALPLCKTVLDRKPNPEAGSFKYYVLERNIYGLLQAMCTSSGYEDRLNDYLSFLGISDREEFSRMTASEFDVKFGKETVVRFCNEFRADMLSYLYDGLMDDATNGDGLQVVVAYDLFNSFYKLVFPTLEQQPVQPDTTQEESREAFLNYAGSMFISYVPVIGVSLNELDGGEVDRFMQFAKAPEDFVAACEIPALRTAELEDLRVFKYDSAAE